MIPTPPSISAGGGGPSGSSSNAGVQTPISNPFNFDGSGWVINFAGQNRNDVGGSTGANQTTQSPDAAGGGGGLLGGITGNPTMLILLGLGALLMLRR